VCIKQKILCVFCKLFGDIFQYVGFCVQLYLVIVVAVMLLRSNCFSTMMHGEIAFFLVAYEVLIQYQYWLCLSAFFYLEQ
jgi:hypothetical protein